MSEKGSGAGLPGKLWERGVGGVMDVGVGVMG